MAKTNINATRTRPEVSELLTLRVVASRRLSQHFQRVSLGEGDIARFRPMGFDQWFRLFIPVAGDSLPRLPNKLNTLSYLKFLTIAKTSRPVLRNYTVRAYHDDPALGQRIDVDVVLHGSDGHAAAGPGVTWAQTCKPGDAVALLDEGIGFKPSLSTDDIRLVGDESALPAIAGILARLPADARGHAVVEVPSDDDRQPVTAPDGVTVTWLVRHERSATPGTAVLAAARELPATVGPSTGWVSGEQALVTGLRRHWVAAGVPKDSIMFCGYWRAGPSR